MKVWICDDEPNILRTLESMLRAEGVEDIRATTSWKALVKALDTEEELPDVIFLDIVFDDVACVEPGNLIHAEYPWIPLVYITGHLEYSADIFDAAPRYLLKKPFQQERLRAALQAAERTNRENAERVLTIQIRGEYYRIPIHEIEYIESDRRKLRLHGRHEPPEWYGKLSDLRQQLPDHFAQPHQSFLVNMKRIRQMKSNCITMYSGDTIPISQQRRQKFRDTFVWFTAHGADDAGRLDQDS